MTLEERAARHAALGDPKRLLIADALAESDMTVRELSELAGIPSNLLAHHLDILESAGIIARRVSEGDRRRRYVTLNWEALSDTVTSAGAVGESVLFVCTHNSARSQYAAALWEKVCGSGATSAGTQPADRVHPKAIQVAGERGIDLSDATPVGYDSVAATPDLLISVCDRAGEGDLPPARRHLHWSVPDPVSTGRLEDFRRAFNEIERRIEHLSRGAADDA